MTCLCGEDDAEVEARVRKAVQDDLIDEEELEDLFPSDKFERMNRVMRTKVPDSTAQIPRTRPD